MPEILKKHTHVRTIYKHHYKQKPKHKESQHDRQDPYVAQGTLHSKFQTRPHWMDNLMPTYKAAIENQDAVSLNKWHQNFDILNKKKKKDKKNSLKVNQAPESGEEEDTLTFESFNKMIKQPKKSHNKYHQPIQVHSFQKYEKPKPASGSSTMKINAYVQPYNNQDTSPYMYSQFTPPHLLKITEEDIRINSPSKKHFIPNTDWGTSGKTVNRWPPIEEDSSEDETNYKISTPVRGAQTSNDSDEFIPFQSSMQKQPNYSEDSADSEETVYDSKPLRYITSYLKNRQNKKNARFTNN